MVNRWFHGKTSQTKVAVSHQTSTREKTIKSRLHPAPNQNDAKVTVLYQGAEVSVGLGRD